MKILSVALTIAALASIPLLNADIASAQPKACPPGLAKKNLACAPPGLAKSNGSGSHWSGKDLTGVIIDRGDFTFLKDYSRYQLPRLPYSQRYAVVDDRLVIIDRDSYQILQLIRVFTDLAE